MFDTVNCLTHWGLPADLGGGGTGEIWCQLHFFCKKTKTVRNLRNLVLD